MTPLSDYRSYRNFGRKAKGLTIIHDTKPDSFYRGWTVKLVINDDEVISCFSKPTLHEAMTELRYKLSKVTLIGEMVRQGAWRDRYSTGSQSFTADFRSDFWWCRKTLHIDKDFRPELRIHLEPRHRNPKGQWTKHEPYVDITIFGKTVKELKTTMKGLLAYAKA